MKIALEIAKDIFKKAQEFVENTIPNVAKATMNKYIMENEVAQKAIDKFRTYSSIISAIPIEDKALIEKEFNEVLFEEQQKQTKINNALNNLQNTQENIKEKNKITRKNINNGINKVFDRRQVITRESDLGNGEEPM